MSSMDSIFSSGDSEQRWVDRITNFFENEVAISIWDIPISIFNVPKTVSVVKPEAYVPQVIGLGPYHHMQPELYQMEKYKLAAVRGFLKPDQILNFQHLMIDKVKEIEPSIRACYHKYLDLDDDTLAWIMSIDGLFLLDVLRNYADTNYSQGRKLKPNSILYRDLMVLENQLPVILLKEIRKNLGLSSADDKDDADLFSMLKGFCQAHSPLKLALKSKLWHETSRPHLLDLMYHLIVNHREIKKMAPHYSKVAPQKASAQVEMVHEDLIHNVGEIVDMGIKLGIGGKVLKPVEVIRNMPWEMISNLLGLKTGNKVDEDDDRPIVEEIKIPSVSSLCKNGGVKFSHTIGGIRDLQFVEEEVTLYLPVITLNAHSEVVLRNLVAYEMAMSDSTPELAQYVDLMCGIVDTAEDAKLLREKGIIKGDLGNEEIADLFNGMNKSSGKTSNRTVEKINEYYSKRPRVKAYRFFKKHVYASWKVLTVVSTILLLLLLILYSFCQVFGCSRLFHLLHVETDA